MHTEPRVIIRTIPLKDKAKSSTMQLGRPRRQLGKKVFSYRECRTRKSKWIYYQKIKTPKKLYFVQSQEKDDKKINNG